MVYANECLFVCIYVNVVWLFSSIYLLFSLSYAWHDGYASLVVSWENFQLKKSLPKNMHKLLTNAKRSQHYLHKPLDLCLDIWIYFDIFLCLYKPCYIPYDFNIILLLWLFRFMLSIFIWFDKIFLYSLR